MKKFETKTVKCGNELKFKLTSKDYYGVVRIRYNDGCGNGHNTFAITGDWMETGESGNSQNPSMCGCIHDEILKATKGTKQEKFFKDAIKFHLMSSDSPMYYYANTMYHASDKDNGYKKGEANSWKEVLQFGEFPRTYKGEKSFIDVLKGMKKSDFVNVTIEPIAHKKDNYDYADKYYLSCTPVNRWCDGQFDTKNDAQEFLDACRKYPLKFKKIITGYSKGKKVELESARSCAIWPNATLKQLRSKKSLSVHLGHVMKEFHNFITVDCGFEY